MQKRLTQLLQNRHSPFFLLGLVGVLAYGLVITRTGFYWDDLPMSWIRYELGTQAMTEYFSTNRPVWGWLYQLTTRLIPQVPIYWQVFALVWRLACAGLVWSIASELWPGRRVFAMGTALLFLVYPGFNGHWAAYLYSHFYIVLALFLFSLQCSLLSLRRGSWWLVPGLVCSALNLWMMEYFFVLELARPALIWAALRNEKLEPRERLLQTLQHWWPYLLVFVLAILSRIFVFNNQVYGMGLLPRLQADFAGTALSIFRDAATSFWTVALAAWLQAFQAPDTSVYGPRTLFLYAAVIVILTIALLAWLWAQTEKDEHNRKEAWTIIGLGLVMLPFASAPFWLIDLPVTIAFPANRFTLPSMFPAALIIAGLIELVRSARFRYALLVVLTVLAAGRQFLWGTDFSRDWETHKNLFWQMSWRAPGLRPDTMVLINEGALKFYADNSLAAAMNWIYAPWLEGDTQIPYLLFHPTNRLEGSLPSLEPGQQLNYDFLVGSFSGSTSQVVSFYFLPPGCLRVLDAEIDSDNHFIPDQYMMREGAALSSADWITSEQTLVMPGVYRPEPAHDWCYYFEKADLSRQMGDWQAVVRLGNEAFARGGYPNDPSERFVFIEGYAHMGEWEQALEQSIQAHKISPKYADPMLCKLWERIEEQTSQSQEKEQALSQITIKLACSGE